jgi:hypothetical protein
MFSKNDTASSFLKEFSLITDQAGSSAALQQRCSIQHSSTVQLLRTDNKVTGNAASISVPLQEISQPTFVIETPVTGYLCLVSPRKSIGNL